MPPPEEPKSPHAPLDPEDARGILDHLLADLPGVIYRCRNVRSWTMVGLTANVKELTGWTVAELVGNAGAAWVDLIHLDDRDRVWTEVQEQVDAGRPFRVVYRIETREGHLRWVLEQGRSLEDDGDTLLTGYIQDITGPLADRLSETQEDLAEARRKTRKLELLQSVTRMVNRERSLEDALAVVVPDICRAFSFTVGHAFVIRGADGDLASSDIWYLADKSEELQAFVEATTADHWKPEEGLPGRVMDHGAGEWVEDVRGDPAFHRISGEEAPAVRSGVAVPIVSESRTLAVLEFYTDRPTPSDPALIAILEQIGVQVGRVWERQEADREQRISEQLFTQLADRSDMVFWMSDPEGNTLYLSPGFEALFGTSRRPRGREEVVAMVHPDDQERLADLFSRPDRAPYDIEYRIEGPDGELRWVRQKAFPLLDEKGEVFRIGGLAEDFTEEHRARARLEETSRLLEQTFSSLEEAVLVIDTTGTGRGVVEANPAAERIFGHTRDELLGDTTEKLHVDRATFQRFAVQGDPVLRDEGVFRAAFPMKRKDGRVFEAEQTVTLLDPAEGLSGGAVSVIRDVSERRRAEDRLRRTEEHFRALIESSVDVIGILDEELVTRYVSPAVYGMLGYRPEEIVGTRGTLRLHPDDREGAIEELRTVLDEPGSIVRQSHRMLHKDGSVRHVESRAQNLLHEPSVQGIVVNLRDVTDQRELEHQLRQAQKMEAVGRLAGGIAHDFNNLLTVIRGQSDFLLLELAPESPAAEEVAVIRNAADRAARLTNQLLAFSREQVLRPRIVDVNQIVEGVEQLLHRVLGEDISIVTELAPEIPPVRVDPGQLEQVLMNLAVNARDAMPEGGTLTVATGREVLSAADVEGLPGLEPGPAVRLTMADTGLGMDEATQAQVFDPFFTTKGQQGGTGLGLSMSYGIVKQSGGAIHVDSEPGAGTTFIVRFPPVEDAVAEPVTRSDLYGALTASEVAGVVLLVEDDDSVRRVARRILERAGLRVHAVADAEAALEHLEEAGEETDLLLTDLVLPGLGGRELVDRVREELPHMRVVVMSGYAEGSPGRREDLPAEVAFVQKPFSPDGLTGVVRRKLAEG